MQIDDTLAISVGTAATGIVAGLWLYVRASVKEQIDGLKSQLESAIVRIRELEESRLAEAKDSAKKYHDATQRFSAAIEELIDRMPVDPTRAPTDRIAPQEKRHPRSGGSGFRTMLGSLLILLLSACVPVTIVPQRDQSGKPIPVPVAQTQPPPESPREDFADVGAAAATSSSWSWLAGLIGIAGAVGGTGAAGFAMRAVVRYKSALKIASELADQMEHADTDAAVIAAKNHAIIQQDRAGVRSLTNRVRGKA